MNDDSIRWFGVRTVTYHPDLSVYEERITLWQAQDLGLALELALEEASDYSQTVNGETDSFAQAFGPLYAAPSSGAEVFSLMRTSGLSFDGYLQTFFETGAERQGGSTST